MREALGFTEPGYCHLPLILDMQGRKLSKRDGDVEVHSFRKAGYLPEALLNFIALLGWSPGQDREKMTLEEMIQLFSLERINKANAKFDRDKLLAFNTDAIAAATEDRLAAGLKDFLSLNDTAIPWQDEKVVRPLAKANRGIRTFADVIAKCNVLFLPDDAFAYDPKQSPRSWPRATTPATWSCASLRPVLACHRLDARGPGEDARRVLQGEEPRHGQGRPADPRGGDRHDDQPGHLRHAADPGQDRELSQGSTAVWVWPDSRLIPDVYLTKGVVVSEVSSARIVVVAVAVAVRCHPEAPDGTCRGCHGYSGAEGSLR